MNILLLFLITTSGVNSLLMPASSYGMVTGFSASRDVEAIFYNPARFSAQEDYSLWLSYNQFYLSTQSASLALVKRLGRFNVGLSLLNFDYGDMELRPNYPTEDSLTYYSAHDFSAGLYGNVHLPPYGWIGVGIKYIYEQIYAYSGGALAFDVSFAYRSEKTGISIGASNFGGAMTLYNESVNLPARLSFGALYDFEKVIASVDAHYLVNHQAWEGGVGAEVPLNKTFGILAAVNYREELYPGFGVTVNSGKMRIRYAGAIYPKDLGLINSLGVGFDF